MSSSDSIVAHHFEDIEQQRDSATLGMWLFLTTEVMFFGGLFAAYIVMRVMYPEAFIIGSQTLSVGLGTFNTFILLVSSLTVALASRAAQIGNRNHLVWYLVATVVLGTIFLGVKVIEYQDKFAAGMYPQPGFTMPEAYADYAAHAAQVNIFLFLYFVMTGMHALHMIIGIPLIAIIAILAYRGRYTRGDYMTVENTGLYWHFVDIVWIFLFPLLYLIDRTGNAV